jgi:hypothetical protein
MGSLASTTPAIDNTVSFVYPVNLRFFKEAMIMRKIPRKLSLNKETLRQLDERSLAKVAGLTDDATGCATCQSKCGTCSCGAQSCILCQTQ